MYNYVVIVVSRLDFRRLPGPVFDPPRMSAGSFSRTAAGNRAYVVSGYWASCQDTGHIGAL